MRQPGAEPAPLSPLTTLLASGWGLVSTYIFFSALLTTVDLKSKLLTFFSSFLPLVAVWATVERKRWGRLALLGLSTTALGLFLAAFGFLAAMDTSGMPLQQLLDRLLPHFVNRTTLGLLLLVALANVLWLRRPTVAMEFEQNKRKTLAVAQQVIATSLVGCWGIIMLVSPFSAAMMVPPPSRPSPASAPKVNKKAKTLDSGHRRSVQPDISHEDTAQR